MTSTRRLGLALVCVLAIATACGSDDTSDTAAAATSSADTSTPASDPSTTSSADTLQAGFPVTITHAQGTVTIATKPQRIVTLGVADAQIASALGADIVGATRNPTRADGNWPGVEPPLDADVTVLSDQEPDIEQIAAMDPDLILATTAFPTYGQMYDQLSAIAPVISYQTALLADDGDDLTALIGQALGEDELARDLIDESATAIADYVESHPGLEGKTYALGQYFSGTLQVLAGADAPSTEFLARFGLSVPDALASLDNGSLPAGMAGLSAEQFGLLDDADAAYLRMYGEGAEAEFRANPLVPSLRIEQEGALHIISDDMISLLFAPNPAVTAEIIEQFGPLLDQLATS